MNDKIFSCEYEGIIYFLFASTESHAQILMSDELEGIEPLFPLKEIHPSKWKLFKLERHGQEGLEELTFQTYVDEVSDYGVFCKSDPI